jgi:hypothetical protein
MNNRATMIGTLLLMGALFLSLNALAVSARPGDGTTAEKMTSIAVAILPGATASETIVPAEGLVAVPVPPPTLNPILIGSSHDVAMQPAMDPIEGPSAAPGPGITPPSASVRETQGVVPGTGVYPPSPGQTGPFLPGNGMINPGLTPVPIPPLTPGMGKVTPTPVPPYSVDPVRNSH